MNHLRDITALLKLRLGLNDQALGPRVVEPAVHHRMEQRQLARGEQYWADLRQSEVEFGHLVDEVVVPESWFFRDRTPFLILAQHLSRRSRMADRTRPLRILSAPCAAGEEPYSIAMTLVDAGLRAGEFIIDAVDISERLLAAARRRVYRAASFRGPDLAFQRRFFDEVKPGEFRLSPAIQSSVQFFRANLVQPDFGDRPQAYDVIFCRNLLIYLEEPSRRQVLRNMDRLLATGGLLVVGHAEAGSVSLSGFEPAKTAGAFAFHKNGGGLAREQPARPAAATPLAPQPNTGPRTPGHEARLRDKPASSAFLRDDSRSISLPPAGSADGEISGPGAPVCRITAAEIELREVQTLADSGKLKEAAALCAHYVKRHRTCPRGLYVFGVVRLAEGRKREAEELFNQVVYLEPRHTEAMIHLAHLAEARGELTVANRWRQRVARIEARPALS